MPDRAGTDDSELVIGFVGPVGIDSQRYLSAASKRLGKYGYHSVAIRLSGCLDALAAKGLVRTPLASEPEFERIRSHMDAGDELRGLEPPGTYGLLAAAAIAEIASRREHLPSGDTRPLRKHAWLISSLKNPAEVEVLRRVYGAGFFLIGLFATESERRTALVRAMSDDEASALIARDTDSEKKHGQQTRKTFEQADVWVRNEQELCRFLDLIFGDTFTTPTDEEDGMALAYASSLRSSDLSRQVGAAIVARTGEVLATGRNEVPAPGGGQYSPPSERRPSARDCDVGEDFNAKERIRIEQEVVTAVDARVREQLSKLASSLDRAASAQLEATLNDITAAIAKALPETSLRDITEYGRAVHAEMSALMSAARVGVQVRGATLYCTTFPCHGCAKHIVAAGIERVVYVEPYPKSRARDLHADSIELVGEIPPHEQLAALTARVATDRTKFEPFVGVGPRRYFDLFSMKLGSGREMRRKDVNGHALKFEPADATLRIDLATRTYLEEEIETIGVLEELSHRKSPQ